MSYRSALAAAGADVLAFKSFGSYQGDWWAKVRFEGKEYWVHGSFGSCSYCDAYESTFNRLEEDACDEHRYEPVDGCTACAAAPAKYAEALREFGRSYLTGNEFTQEEAEKAASEDIDWDDDVPEMVAFLKDNAIESRERW